MTVSAALGRDVVVGLVHVFDATHTPFRAGPARGIARFDDGQLRCSTLFGPRAQRVHMRHHWGCDSPRVSPQPCRLVHGSVGVLLDSMIADL